MGLPSSSCNFSRAARRLAGFQTAAELVSAAPRDRRLLQFLDGCLEIDFGWLAVQPLNGSPQSGLEMLRA